MSTLKTSDLEEMTGLSQRYWQRRIAAGEVPGAEELVCGTGRRFLIDSTKFSEWWAKQRRPVTCQKISVSEGKSGGIASTTKARTSKPRSRRTASPSLVSDLKQFVNGAAACSTSQRRAQ